jgi:hypothetical protein
VPFQGDAEIEYEEIVSNFNSDLDSWTQEGGGSLAVWAWSSDMGGTAKVTTINTFGAKNLRRSSVSLPQQEFTLRFKYAMPAFPRNSSQLQLQLIIYDASNVQLYNTLFGLATSGEAIQDFLITDSNIWENADSFLLIVKSTGYVAGDQVHISEVSYIYPSPQSYKVNIIKEDETVIPLEVTGEDGNYLASFTPSELDLCDEKVILRITKVLSLPELSEWNNKGFALPPWTLGAAPSIEITPSAGQTSDALYKLVPSLLDADSTSYTFNYELSASGMGPDVNALNMLITLLKDGTQIASEPIALGTGTSFTGSVVVDSPENPDEVWVQMSWTNVGDAYTVTLESFTIDAFENLSESDCLDIRTSYKESLLINYTNGSNYAGINYGDFPAPITFNLRIPAIFFESRFPQEGEDIELSGGRVISLNSTLKEQRLLSTDRMPAYMHRKIGLILNHQFVFIDGEYWVKGGENYDKKEKSNKRDPFDMYTCWLTRQDFIARNIL